MLFSKEFISNAIFEESVLTMDYVPKPSNYVQLPAHFEIYEDYGKSAILREDGSWLVRIDAPKAQRVTIIMEFGDPGENGYAGWRDAPIEAKKNEDGVFEAAIPWSANKAGPRNIDVYLDDTLVLWPYLPIMFSGNRAVNYLEVPAEEMTFSYIEDVPHGSVINEIFWSSARNRWERCVVYTPPGYMKGTDFYPVLYLTHGGYDNETSWVSKGRAQYTLDNLIAAGKAVPMLLVMINDMYSYPENLGKAIVDLSTEDTLIRDCIPHIESTYRVRTDKWSRAIAGLSRGSMMANDIGLRHPELFGSIGAFTSSMYHETFETTYERPWKKALADPDSFVENYRVFFASATPQEDHLPYFLKDGELMEESGIAARLGPGYKRIVHAPNLTRWESWRMGLRDFAAMLFKELEEK